MKLELLERRRIMLKNHNSGISLADNVNFVSHTYGITRQAAYKDWSRRKHWVPLLIEINDQKQFFYDSVAHLFELRRQATREALQADNSAARIGALRLNFDITMKLIELGVLSDMDQRLCQLEQQGVTA
jgi:hypothetical protein